MITEATALEIAQADARRIHKHLENGAMPDQVGRAFFHRIVRHIDSFESEKASEAAREAAQKRMTAPTFSEHLIARAMAICTRSMRHLEPEDTRALMLWLVGTPPTIPGFMVHVVNQIGETAGPEAIQKAYTQTQALLDRMQKVDDHLFNEQVKGLSNPRQRILRGMLLRAQWTFHAKDGITARNQISLARRLAMRWVQQQKTLSEAFGDP
jgi:hypothetical protein